MSGNIKSSFSPNETEVLVTTAEHVFIQIQPSDCVLNQHTKPQVLKLIGTLIDLNPNFQKNLVRSCFFRLLRHSKKYIYRFDLKRLLKWKHIYVDVVWVCEGGAEPHLWWNSNTESRRQKQHARKLNQNIVAVFFCTFGLGSVMKILIMKGKTLIFIYLPTYWTMALH